MKEPKVHEAFVPHEGMRTEERITRLCLTDIYLISIQMYVSPKGELYYLIKYQIL